MFIFGANQQHKPSSAGVARRVYRGDFVQLFFWEPEGVSLPPTCSSPSAHSSLPLWSVQFWAVRGRRRGCAVSAGSRLNAEECRHRYPTTDVTLSVSPSDFRVYLQSVGVAWGGGGSEGGFHPRLARRCAQVVCFVSFCLADASLFGVNTTSHVWTQSLYWQKKTAILSELLRLPSDSSFLLLRLISFLISTKVIPAAKKKGLKSLYLSVCVPFYHFHFSLLLTSARSFSSSSSNSAAQRFPVNKFSRHFAGQTACGAPDLSFFFLFFTMPVSAVWHQRMHQCRMSYGDCGGLQWNYSPKISCLCSRPVAQRFCWCRSILF